MDVVVTAVLFPYHILRKVIGETILIKAEDVIKVDVKVIVYSLQIINTTVLDSVVIVCKNFIVSIEI